MKRVLIVASVISFIEWFNKENVDFLCQELGCEVHIACNFEYLEDTDADSAKNYIQELKSKGIFLHLIRFARSPLSFRNITAFKELKRLINDLHFDLIHCHTPVASMLTRLASKKARKKGSVVMYTCHGFHFHNAAPKKNWLLYYPIEKWLSKHCDYLVTINHEDYERAKTFHCKNVRYIPGVGVDLKRIFDAKIDKASYKESIGVPRDSILLLSIGEMIERKNHQVIIKALGKLNNPSIYYAICGKGPLKEKLQNLARKEGLEDRVLFLGFRKDIPELCNAADISAFPSKIEGLGLAGIEAMAAGVPLISSNVHGILDYVVDGKTGFAVKPNDVNGFAVSIDKLSASKELRYSMRDCCIKQVRAYDKPNALQAMRNIYQEILHEGQNNCCS